MQLGMTSYCLYGLRRFSVMFFMSSMLQVTPFVMTIRRKNLISTPATVGIYGMELVFGSIMSIYEVTSAAGIPKHARMVHGMLIDLAVLLRLGPRLPVIGIIQNNKFLMWAVIGLLLRHLRPVFDQDVIPPELYTIEKVNKTLMFCLFIWKGFLRDRFEVKKTKTV